MPETPNPKTGMPHRGRLGLGGSEKLTQTTFSVYRLGLPIGLMKSWVPQPFLDPRILLPCHAD